MVEVLCTIPQDVARSLSPAPNRGVSFSPAHTMTREEHMLKEMNLRRHGLRRGPPKRSATVSDYSGPAVTPFMSMTPSTPTSSTTTAPTPPSSSYASGVAAARGIIITSRPMTYEPKTKPTTPTTPTTPSHQQQKQQQQPTKRPTMGAPRRSYSVMDYTPTPPCEQPSSGLALPDLPTELHYTIFDHLDPIDSTCLGLTSTHFYAVHRRFQKLGGPEAKKEAKLGLTTRREGPNDVEWAWRLAGHANPNAVETHSHAQAQAEGNATTTTNGAATTTAAETAPSGEAKGLSSFSIRGPTYCPKCGATRCELHRHIKEWMGEGYEYCAVQERFAKVEGVAPAMAGRMCYRRKPNDPHACGKHRKGKRVATF